MITIGVLALQGDFAEHIAALKRLDVAAREVRTPADLEGLSGLIIPGGESTAIYRLMTRWGLIEPIASLARRGTPVWGTCAGLILISRRILDDPLPSMRLLDVDVVRNAYGRQVDSFETSLPFPALGEKDFPAIFIRAPLIKNIGPGVEVLASLPDGSPAAVRQGNILGSSFHPELTPDSRLHAFLVQMAEEHQRSSNVAAI